ncbi:MAG: hypothetical protein GFH27_549367n32 [Chloroflexi bacterium AL-W]|nr:hypothetical protein [Chloroflexi bacterium AL-W]
MNIINQFSYPLISVGVLVIAYVTLTRVLNARWYITTFTQLALVGVFASGFFLLRPTSTPVDSVEEALATIHNGRPTFVAFFSQYCTVCLTIRPIVDDLVQEIEADYDVLQIDIHNPLGRGLRQRLGFSFTPEFVLYNIDGEEIWRDHAPPTASLLNQLSGLCESC